MPTVPSYDNRTVGISEAPGVRFNTPTAENYGARQAQALGSEMSRAGGQMFDAAMQQIRAVNQDRVNDASNQAQQALIKLKAEALQLQGKNALERPDNQSLADEYSTKFKQSMAAISDSLSNDDQKKAFSHITGQMDVDLQGSLTSHMLQQQKVYRNENYASTIDIATQQAGLLWGDANAVAQSKIAISNTIDAMAQENGWDKTIKQDKLNQALSPMHSSVITNMLAGGNTDMAKKYYEENSAEMSNQARANILPKITASANDALADTTAQSVWDDMGPKTANDAVNIFNMEQKVRQSIKDNPDAVKSAISGLRERLTAFNAQQAEQKASNISGVWKQIDAGTSFNQIKNSDSWLSLSDLERHQIREQLQREAATDASRAASESSRQLTDLQRREKMLYLQNADQYLTASDPAVLSKMSRAQVEAKRSIFGIEPTQQLLNKWDSLQKPANIAAAQMDQVDFNQIADSLGLSPYAKKTEESARALGTLKFNIEQYIDVQQRQIGRQLTRQEKMDLMRNEMARTVTVDPGFWHANKTVPVIQLNRSQTENVVVPAADRTQIIEAMRTQYARNPRKEFEPTDANIRAWYLRKQSPAAGVITDGQ